MKDLTEIILFLFAGMLLVLVVTHASGFAKAVTAVGGQVNTSASLLSGAGVSNSDAAYGIK